VQLCAQAICLEEMLDVSVPAGALFYGRPRRRTDVLFDEPLRRLTESTARRLHDLIESRLTPVAAYDSAKCDRCSLLDLCMPAISDGRRTASRYLARAVNASLEVDLPGAES